MSSSINSLIPAGAALLVIAACFAASLSSGTDTRAGLWRIPAALSAVFFAASLVAAARGGPVGFWPEHVRNDWGNQIFVDLLLCAASAYFLILPRAKAVGMRPLLWLVGIAALGSIGLLAMLSRVLYLEQKA